MIEIRTINVLDIENKVAELCVAANCHLGSDVLDSLKDAALMEKSHIGKAVLNQLLENADIAHNEEIPICQDTGFAIIFLEIGQDVTLAGGGLYDAVNRGVRTGYTEGFLRKSMVGDPLNRINTGDNTPAIIHTTIVPGSNVKITVAPKGGGSENMSALKMLKPAEGIEGVKAFVIDTVKSAGPNPCPPIVVGVGIGGSMEKAALMSKEALTRNLGESNADPETQQLERELLMEINKIGIGPQGLGGQTTALAVHIERFPTHIACLPVAVNLSCHGYRHKSAVI